MGLSLKQVTEGAANLGNLLLGGVEKFNTIRREVAGVTPTTASVPAINQAAATTGTVQQKLQTSGTVAQQVEAATTGTKLSLVVIVAVVLALIYMSHQKGG